MLAALDALRELDLLCCGEQRNLPDVLQEQLQRVGRDLSGRLDLGLGVVDRVGVDDGDLRLFERRVEVVELSSVEVELVQGERELVGVQLARAVAALQQSLALVTREDLLDRRSSGSALRSFSGQTAPFFSSAVTR